MRRTLRLVLALSLVAACSGGDDDAGPGPSPSSVSTTVPVDRSGVVLAGVPGETTTTAAVAVGTARITGSVQGPLGPVAGAVVRVDRLLAEGEARTDLVSGPDGRFLLEGVPGGRYRVRAFLAPTLAQTTPEVTFLADGTEHDFALVVEEQSGLVARGQVAPAPPVLGRSVNLVAVVATRTVDPDGIVRSAPIVGVRVELGGLGRWVLRNDSPSTTSTTDFFAPSTSFRFDEGSDVTDFNGSVRFELRCHETGDPGLYLRVPVRDAPVTSTPDSSTTSSFVPSQTRIEVLNLDLPDCQAPAPPTTTASSTSDTGGSGDQ